eukprot:TRINITY_DN14933_c0_g3_i1.p1 TRINITY_DN14933_c0_g3~~TRINITY_DN14933_c0_g3_i1.p1  ORF type:complete len:237 (+),score=40.73 TRINITY_DN14933_c0_g3_i1:72-782(+)
MAEPPYSKQDLVEVGCNCRSSRSRGSSAYLGRLQRDLLGSFYWSGNCLKDYLFFVANWHPLFGIFLSHPAHPWSKTDRTLMLIVSCGLSMLPAALVGITEKKADSDVVEALATVAIFTYITIPVMIWEVVLYKLGTLYTTCLGRCDCFAKVVKFEKICCFIFTLLVTMGAVSSSVVLAFAADVNLIILLRPVAEARVQSWLVWFPLYAFMPCFGFIHAWHMEQRSARKAACQSPAV